MNTSPRPPRSGNQLHPVLRGQLALTLFLLAPGAFAQSDNFNDGNDTSPPPAWTRYNPIGTGSWSFPGGNTYRLQSAPSPDPINYGQGRAGSIRPENYTNFYVSVDIVNWDDSIQAVAGVLARLGNVGPGTTRGYMFTHDRGNPLSSTAGDMDIVRLDNERPVNLPTTGADSIHFEVGKSYRLVFIGVGTNFTGLVYELPETITPLIHVTASDSTYASGLSGLVVADNSSGSSGPADVTFDNYLAAPAPNLFDNFNDGNDTQPVPAWQHYDPLGGGTFSFPGGNTYRIATAPSPDPANYGPARTGSVRPQDQTSFYVRADIVAWDDSMHQIAGVMARVGTPGPGTTTGYLFTHDRGNPLSSTAGDMDIVRVDGEVGTGLPVIGADSIHFNPGTTYRLEFIGSGDSLTGRVYELPNLSQPVIEMVATDGTYPSGSPGLVVVNNSTESGLNGPADTTFDNFLAVDAEPRLAINRVGSDIQLTWPIVPFSLQRTPSLSAPSWTTVTTGITQSGDQNIYTVPPGGSANFYRLVYP